jgi:hypothetical protein
VRRPVVVALAIAGLVVFLAVSAILARAFSIDDAERAAITAVVQAEARGEPAAILAQMTGCSERPSCRTRVLTEAAVLRRSGAVSIIQIQPSAGFSLSGTTGIARVAWKAGGSLPIVQCLRVRRAGNVANGLRVELLTLSPRIASDADCPARF